MKPMHRELIDYCPEVFEREREDLEHLQPGAAARSTETPAARPTTSWANRGDVGLGSDAENEEYCCSVREFQMLRVGFGIRDIHRDPIGLPQRRQHQDYRREPIPPDMMVPEVY
jgi:hypothetical protein